ncbi:hypothetical protein cypCar_00027925 [Cyprinus carpio]|nr:hypothetical protein cypCar_00027925 [Cyprinus carpio]
MSFRKCKEPCTRFITKGDTHERCVVCLGLHHAQSALSGLSSCPHCDGLRLKVLRSRVEVFSKVAPASNPRRVASAAAEAPHEAMAWGDMCDLTYDDSAALEFSPHRSLSPTRVQDATFVEPVVFSDGGLQPTPEAYDAISFGCGQFDDDVLSTAASESEDFVADTDSPLPPSGQEKRVSPSYSELLDVVSRAVGKLGLDWEVEKAEAQPSSKLDDRFLTSRAPAQPRRPLPFFPDLHQEVSRLESPTRSLSMDAPKGVHVKALAGNVDVTAHFDIQLHSTAGLLILDAESVRLPTLPVGGTRTSGHSLRMNNIYEVCVCPSGKFFISRAGVSSTCSERQEC